MTMLTELQKGERSVRVCEFCKNILKQIEKGNIVDGQLYKIDNNILKRFIIDGNGAYEMIVILRSLIPQVL